MINYLIVTLLLYFEMSTILGDDVMVDGVYIVTSVASVTVIPIMSVICFYFYDIIVISFFFMFKCNFELYNVRNYYCTWKKINYYYIIKIEAYHWVCTWKHTSYQSPPRPDETFSGRSGARPEEPTNHLSEPPDEGLIKKSRGPEEKGKEGIFPLLSFLRSARTPLFQSLTKKEGGRNNSYKKIWGESMGKKVKK